MLFCPRVIAILALGRLALLCINATVVLATKAGRYHVIFLKESVFGPRDKKHHGQ